MIGQYRIIRRSNEILIEQRMFIKDHAEWCVVEIYRPHALVCNKLADTYTDTKHIAMFKKGWQRKEK